MTPPGTSIEERVEKCLSTVKIVLAWKFVPTTLLKHRINNEEPFHEGYFGALCVDNVLRTSCAISIKEWVITFVPKDGFHRCEIYHEDTIYYINDAAPLTLKPERFVSLLAKIFLQQELLRGCALEPQKSETQSIEQVDYHVYGAAFPEHIFKKVIVELQNYQGEGVLEYVPPSRT